LPFAEQARLYQFAAASNFEYPNQLEKSALSPNTSDTANISKTIKMHRIGVLSDLISLDLIGDPHHAVVRTNGRER
jgi:hypothetical protein